MAYKNLVLIIFAIATVQAVSFNTKLSDNVPCTNTCFNDLHGDLEDCSSKVDTIDYFNNVKIFPRIQSLVSKDYFRFYKVNLKKECPFWVDDSRCAMKYCHIKTCSKDSVPEYPEDETDRLDEHPSTIYMKESQNCGSETSDHDLGYLNMTISAASQYEIAKWKAYDDALDNFCECDDKDVDAEYIDLTFNPERFTGYKGPSAHRIWKSIYQENCFRPKSNPYKSFPYVQNSDLKNMCLEKRVFYRAISGLHSSINIHLCSKYLLPENGVGFMSPEGEWGPNLEEFQRRFDPSQTFNEGPNWLKNLYFLYLLEMRALAKAAPYLEREEYYTGNPTEDEEMRQAIKNMLGIILTFPDHFNESAMFNGSEAVKLKNEFREHFRNISRIMDCVGCDKCKLWGKLQTQGLGTALKILFSGHWDEPVKDPLQGRLPLQHKSYKRLQRTEIVALFNAFARLSNSIRELENFRTMMRSLTPNDQAILHCAKTTLLRD